MARRRPIPLCQPSHVDAADLRHAGDGWTADDDYLLVNPEIDAETAARVLARTVEAVKSRRVRLRRWAREGWA